MFELLERRGAGVELRAEGRVLVGPAVRYGDISPSHRERIEPGAFGPLDSKTRWLNYAHDADRVIAWTGGGGLELSDGPDALEVRATLPEIPLANLALEEVRGGRMRGLSIEFFVKEETRAAGVRVIRRASLAGVGLVQNPSYQQSVVETRGRLGRSLRAKIPKQRKLACACSGPGCRFAEFAGDAIEEMLDNAFDQVEREIVASWANYSTPLASVSAGTLRRAGVDGVEIDLPDSPAGQAVIAARDAAGIVIRPHIDRALSDVVEVGDTAQYKKAHVRAFIVSSTDAREGWPTPDLVPTPAALLDNRSGEIRPRLETLWL